MISTQVWRDDGNAMIFQTAAASTAVPQEVLSRVVSTAKTEVENLASCDKIAGVARLDGSHGLCAWVRETKAWERFEEPERSAVEAIATNTPRPEMCGNQPRDPTRHRAAAVTGTKSRRWPEI